MSIAFQSSRGVHTQPEVYIHNLSHDLFAEHRWHVENSTRAFPLRIYFNNLKRAKFPSSSVRLRGFNLRRLKLIVQNRNFPQTEASCVTLILIRGS